MDFRQILTLIRLQPFDAASPVDRSRERYRRILLSGMSSFANTGLVFALGLISIPLTLHYLGTERYGLWITMASVAAMLNVADLGIGSGLVTALSTAHGRDDRREAQALVSTAFALLLCISAALGLAFFLASPFIPFARLYNVPAGLAGEARLASTALFTLFLIGLPAGLSLRVQAAHQEGLAASSASMAAGALCFALLLAAVWRHAGLPVLVLVLGGVPTLSSLLSILQLSSPRWRWLLPRWGAVHRGAARRLLALGFSFVLMQVAATVAFTSDNLILAQLLGPAAVATYSVATKVFSVVAVVLQLGLMPLWPAYAEALARGDVHWARAALRRSTRLSLLVSAAASLGLLLAGDTLIRLWVGASLLPPPSLMLALAAWAVTAAVGNSISMFLNGAGWLTSQAVVALVVAALALAGKVWLTPHLGVAGVVWATEIAYLVFSLLPWSLFLPRVLLRLEGSSPARRAS